MTGLSAGNGRRGRLREVPREVRLAGRDGGFGGLGEGEARGQGQDCESDF